MVRGTKRKGEMEYCIVKYRQNAVQYYNTTVP